jgi:TRAP-type mannitol/chloroaromatic compound transport system permease small subunit
MSYLRGLVRVIDFINERIGRLIAWLALGMVLVQVVVVVMRYVFGLSILAMQESIWYMHAIIFLVAAGYTLLHDGHVRVDILYGAVGPKKKALIDFLGVIFILLPVCVMLWAVCWPYVAASWQVHEGSVEVSGIQGVYLLKTGMLVLAATLFIQGISLGIKSAFTLAGIAVDAEAATDGGEHGL